MSAPSGYRIEQAMSAWQSARARLLTDDADLARDEGALAAMLGDQEGDIRSILERLLRAAVHAKSMAETADMQMMDLAARRDRYKRRADSLRGTAFSILDATGQNRFELADMTVTVRAGVPSVQITDAEALTEEYVTVRTERKPNVAAILADLKQGVVIDGAVLRNGMPSLQVRSK